MWPDLGQGQEGSLQYPDHLLLALLQGGLRVQLSGLDPELRESEKAVLHFSAPVGASYRSHKRSEKRVLCINQIVG